MPSSVVVRPTIPLRLVRRIVVMIGAIGIAGIIAGSIANNTGLAITSGLVSAVAIGFLILLTAAVGREAFEHEHTDATVEASLFDEVVARDVEDRIDRLAAAGADEAELRQLVTRAIELGRTAR